MARENSSVEEVSRLLSQWEDDDALGRDVHPVLTKLAEIFELENESFLKQDPDPFDDRHPSRSQPDCTLGHMLKAIFRSQRIVDEMVKVYCQRDGVELHTAVCRLLLNILPGLESVIFQEEGFVTQLFQWSENAPNPLQSYATGLLAAAMDVPEIASSYREKNAQFVPLMLKRLKELSKSYLVSPSQSSPTLGKVASNENTKEDNGPIIFSSFSNDDSSSQRKSKKRRDISKSRYDPIFSEQKKTKEKKSPLQIPPVDAINELSLSNSNWTESMLGSYQIYPLTLAAQQRYILQYLTPMGEYLELVGNVLEENALALILRYIDFNQNHDVRLAFEALKYLASLLCHKKIAIEFLNIGGLKLLLQVPRPSIAATGVSFCLYYLGYLEEALEKICMSPPKVLSELVSYALWLLECSHDSSRCHATLFFGFGFAFKCIVDHFDEQDGLRKMFNVMSTLDIFDPATARTLSEDEVFAKRLTARHVCGSLKRYFEAHLAILVEKKTSHNSEAEGDPLAIGTPKALNLSAESVERNMKLLHETLQLPIFHWKPVNEFVNLDGVTFLLELCASYFTLSYSGKAETVKNALDVLKICALTSAAQSKFCENIANQCTGISVLLQAAEGDNMPVAEVQCSALECLANCVCTRIPSGESSSRSSATPKRKTVRFIETLLNNVWKAVRIKNGIMVLINLLSIKSPIIDADTIRALACKVLCGLARSTNVKQILIKLPLVTDGQLIDLMKEPVLQDRYDDHVQFCKYGLELLERVTGAPLSAGPEYSMNLKKICVSEVVSKTKVVYHDHQLLKLIGDHLSQKGFTKTIECLQKEMDEKLDTPGQPLSLGAFPILQTKSLVCSQLSDSIRPLKKSKSLSKSSSGYQCGSPSSSSIPPRPIPLKIILNKKIQYDLKDPMSSKISETVEMTATSTTSPDIKSPPCRLQKPQMCSGNYIQSPAFSKMKRKPAGHPFKAASEPSVSLDSIVTEYLRKQHALCKNPMLACPPFDLFVPHKCPEPHFKRNAPSNCTLRWQMREMGFENGGYRGASLNVKHIYSRFRHYRTIRDEDGRCDFTTSAFFSNYCEPYLKVLIGTANGSLRVINAHTAKQIMSKDCHFRGVTHIESHKTSPLFITSDGGRIGNSSLWNLSSNGTSHEIDLLNNFNEVTHMEFGKWSFDRLVGTKHDAAVIYDSTSFAELQTFKVEENGNNYAKNRATFDYRDELVLTDGIIFDVRSGRMIHKLDKFNSTMNGLFHPNGREIICNSEIWDMRTFKLLRTVAGLDQSRVTFNPTGTVIYAVSHNKDLKTAGKMSCFYTFDSSDYNVISTFDVKRPVYHLANDQNERFIATIEVRRTEEELRKKRKKRKMQGLENVCRLYELGRLKQIGDESGNESDESEEESADDDDDDDDDVDVEDDNEGSPYQDDGNEISFDVEDDNEGEDDINWITTSDSSDDDESFFALNTSD